MNKTTNSFIGAALGLAMTAGTAIAQDNNSITRDDFSIEHGSASQCLIMMGHWRRAAGFTVDANTELDCFDTANEILDLRIREPYVEGAQVDVLIINSGRPTFKFECKDQSERGRRGVIEERIVECTSLGLITPD